MSWYSGIYTRARAFRKKNPIRGWFLYRCLNALFLCQWIGLFYSLYVYIFHVCDHFISSPVQGTLYLCIYLSLIFMAVWSVMVTIFTPIKKVPSNYVVSQARIEQLQKCTPKEKERYVVDKSTPEQTIEQLAILTDIANELNIVQAECDSAGRLKFCYQCGHMKPDRTHHCSSCGFCVVRFDHHCPWINHCVNYNNYKSFLLYVFYAVITVVWFLLGALECLVRFFIRQQWSEDWLPLLLVITVSIPFVIFGYYPLGELLIYHFQILSLNETTCEQAKPAVLRFDFKADYNMGRKENFRQIFGWGLWFFPIQTTMEDGLHFKIRYQEESNKNRFSRIEVGKKTSSERADSQRPQSQRPLSSEVSQKMPSPSEVSQKQETDKKAV